MRLETLLALFVAKGWQIVTATETVVLDRGQFVTHTTVYFNRAAGGYEEDPSPKFSV
jgi:hypothetical protein